jgi:enoyl-CoA hydratase/carnithine racemase
MIRLELEGDLATIALDRPDKRNALTPEMFSALHKALDEVLWGPARGLILAGNGRVFCGGFDLTLCLDKPGTLEILLRELSAVVTALRAFPKPVVLAAHGAAIAGGCALLAAADLVVADESAKIGYPVVPLGISPAVSAASLRLAIGDGPARERLLDPATISGREAARIGLVHDVVLTPDQVRSRANELASALAAKPPGAFRATKEWLCAIDQGCGSRDAPTASLAASLRLIGGAEEQERLARAVRKP